MQVLHGSGGVTFFAGHSVGCRERAKVTDESQQKLAVRDEIIGVGQAVALNVRRVGVFRVGPPIVAFGREIMEPAGTAGISRGNDGLGHDGEGDDGRLFEPGAFVGSEIKGVYQGGERKEGEHGDLRGRRVVLGDGSRQGIRCFYR